MQVNIETFLNNLLNQVVKSACKSIYNYLAVHKDHFLQNRRVNVPESLVLDEKMITPSVVERVINSIELDDQFDVAITCQYKEGHFIVRIKE